MMGNKYPYGRSVGEDMERAISGLKLINEIMRTALEARINPPLILKEVGGLDLYLRNLLLKKGYIKKSDIKDVLDKWESEWKVQHDGE